MSAAGREDIATVEGGVDFFQPIARLVEVNDLHRQPGLLRIFEQGGQQAIIGADVELRAQSGGNRPAVGADTRVNDGDVD